MKGSPYQGHVYRKTPMQRSYTLTKVEMPTQGRLSRKAPLGAAHLEVYELKHTLGSISTHAHQDALLLGALAGSSDSDGPLAAHLIQIILP